MRFCRCIFPVMLLFPFAWCLKGQTVTCSSNDQEKHYCVADTRQGARLVKQASTVECIEGKTWGWDEEGIWVDQGCGGQFALGKAEAGSGTAPPDHPAIKQPTKVEQRITCTSDDGRRNDCDADLKGATVQLARQLSPSPCTEGSSWGHSDKEIWVDRGCRGEFVVQRQGEFVEVSCDKSVGKKEAKKLVEECLKVSAATDPCNPANSCVLIKEEIRRSCGLLGGGAPKFCEDYKKPTGPPAP
jgi:hypothetical protein